MSGIVYSGHGTTGAHGAAYISGAIRRSSSITPTRRYDKHTLRHPLPGYLMWRGNTSKYMYNRFQTARYGEGEALKNYHQHFSHAKCPNDACKANEMEYFLIDRGVAFELPLPKPQVPPNSKPKWHWKSWHMPYTGHDIWRRELEYPEHIPNHIPNKTFQRPLCVLSPQIMYKQLQSQYMSKVTITVCPLVFGYGMTLQKLATDFYRRCLSIRSLMNKQQVHLMYTTEYQVPVIEIEWLDGSVYSPPLLEGMVVNDLVQLVMEQSFLVADRLNAEKFKIPETEYPDLGRWSTILEYKITRRSKLKQTLETAGQQDAAAATAAAVKK